MSPLFMDSLPAKNESSVFKILKDEALLRKGKESELPVCKSLSVLKVDV